jgi:hypothetical protein
MMKELDSKHQMVQNQVNVMYDLIKMGEKALAVLRSQCDHPESKECNYQWGGPGHIVPATMCSVCGKILKTQFDDIKFDDINNGPICEI